MSDKIFVHYPACAHKVFTAAFDQLLKEHEWLMYYPDRLYINSTPHMEVLLDRSLPFREKHTLSAYMLYWSLHSMLKTGSVPPWKAIARRPQYKEDKLWARYHHAHLDQCIAGVFVPSQNGKWHYQMWRNAQRLLAQGKKVWAIRAKDASCKTWEIKRITHLPRSARHNRQDSIDWVGEFSRFSELPPLILAMFPEKK